MSKHALLVAPTRFSSGVNVLVCETPYTLRLTGTAHTGHDNANNIFQCTGSLMPPICVELSVNGTTLVMKVDTGASVSPISENTYRNTSTAVKRMPLLPSDAYLYMYSGKLIKVLGTTSVTVCYKNQVKKLSVLVVHTNEPSLLGRDWLHTITLDWKQLNRVHLVHHRTL